MRQIVYCLALLLCGTCLAQQRRQSLPETKQAVQQQITSYLSSARALANTSLAAQVSDSSVMLTGSVANLEQHDLALRFAEAYSGGRQVLDQIRIRREVPNLEWPEAALRLQR